METTAILSWVLGIAALLVSIIYKNLQARIKVLEKGRATDLDKLNGVHLLIDECREKLESKMSVMQEVIDRHMPKAEVKEYVNDKFSVLDDKFRVLDKSIDRITTSVDGLSKSVNSIGTEQRITNTKLCAVEDKMDTIIGRLPEK